MLLSRRRLLVVTALIVAVPSASSFSLSHRLQCNVRTSLSMAYGLPDEELQLPDPEESKEETPSDETLKSLIKKLDKSKDVEPKKKDNKAMSFLKQIGRVGGAANKSFVNAVGSDEGSTGRQPAAERKMQVNKKSKMAYTECSKSGVIDDLSESFPITSSGREWRGITDRVMGGVSNGSLRREANLNGRPANVLIGTVSLKNNGGVLQMVTDLALDPSRNFVDASEFDGIEFDVLYRKVDEKDAMPGSFNMHLRTPGTLKQMSYRHTFQIENDDTWETIRIPFSSFLIHGAEENESPSIDPSELRRIGIVALGREVKVFLALGGLRFYSVI